MFSGSFSADSVSPSGNNPYYDLKAPLGATNLSYQPLVPESLVASSTTPYYNLVNGSLQQGSNIVLQPNAPQPVSDPVLNTTNSKVLSVGPYGSAYVPLSGAVGYGVSAIQYAKDSSYFVSSGGSGGNAPSAPDDPSAIPIPTTPGGQGFTFFFSNAGETGEPPISYSFLYGTTSPPTTTVPATRNNATLSIYSATVQDLTSNTPYFVQTVATNSFGTSKSNIVTYTTPASGGTAPGGSIASPTLVNKTNTSITVTVNASAVTGTPAPTIILVYTPPSGDSAIVSTPDAPPVANVYTFTAPGLSESTPYTLRGVATNGTAPDLSGATVVITTDGPTPVPNMKTNAVVTFLIQGPRFNTPYANALDYYINVDAVGCTLGDGDSAISGAQDYGYMYGGSIVTSPATSNAGLCTSDQPFSTTYGATNDAYFTSINNPDVNKLVCWGGFYADILGLFGPYQPGGFPSGGTNPSCSDVVRSFCYNYLGLTSGTNPLNWSRSGYTTTFDGLILDFENVGLGGRPSSNQYPLPQSPVPVFPAMSGSAPYTTYPTILAGIPTLYYSLAPNKFLGNAPVSLSINGDLLNGKNSGNIGAANTALNTWFGFANSTTVPSKATFNYVPSLALNHPEQMSYFDDIFVQFYNEDPDYYLGGAKFTNLLAQWGYVALQAQNLYRKNTLINIGLAKGNIIPGLINGVAVEEAQGPTPPVDSELAGGAPYTFWYPQYATISPPNCTSASQGTPYWANISPTNDPKNLAKSITDANAILQDAAENPNLKPSDWCSGVGFWAGTNATKMAKDVYTAGNANSPGNVLPSIYTYCWADASYPSPTPDWKDNIPIQSTL